MAAAGAHRYWGLYFTGGFYPYGVWVREVELRTSAGGSNVTTPSTPTYANSTEGSNYPQNTVDNSTSTYWSSYPAPAPQRLWWDLQTPVSIAEVAVYPYGSSFGPSEARVQYSDNGSTWTDATGTFTLSNASSWQTIAVEQGPPDPNAPQKTTLTLSLNKAIFSNPDNVYAIDGQYSTGGTNNTNNLYNRYYTNATSVIPANAQILGTEYTIRGRVSTTNYGAYCDVSWDGFANAGNTIAMPTTDTTIVRGGPTTVLGTPTLSNLNNLVMRHSQANKGGTTNWWVDYLGVNVYWKLPPKGPNNLFARLI